MLTEVQKKWCAALRSGAYKQTQGFLCKTNGEDSYCCLGVACELYVKEHGEGDLIKVPSDGKVYYDGRNETLPEKVRKWLGLTYPNGSYNFEYSQCLAKMNDSGRSFEEIAAIIESEPKGLFTTEGIGD